MEPTSLYELRALDPRSLAGNTRRIRLESERSLTFGRDDSCDIAISGEQFPQVSLQHAQVELRDGQPWIRDLGSTNGTLLNGHAIEAEASWVVGNVLQLGDGGPRFLLVQSGRLQETVVVSREAMGIESGAKTKAGLGQTSMRRLRNELGVDEAGVQAMVTRSRRRTQLLLVALAVLALAGAWYGFTVFKGRGEQEFSRLREENMQLREELEQRLNEDRQRGTKLREAVARANEQSELWRTRFTEFVSQVEAERDALVGQLAGLEADGSTSSDERLQLQQELKAAQDKLDLYDPVNLSAQTLQRVQGVQSSVVLIEAEMGWREPESKALLHFDVESDSGDFFSLGEEGEPFIQDSTGSGFCVSEDGWILTNAHVAVPDSEYELMLPGGQSLETFTQLQVVFTGENKRHTAVLHKFVFDEENDLALIKIEPFEGMPHLNGFTTELPTPALGSEVYLFGFPLGTHALQEGNTVIASTFKGILSREVAPYIQVDAGVHPGNSGGPIADAQGRIVGMVTAGQRTPDDQLAYTIGYAIPVSKLNQVWPPAETGADPVD